MSSYAFSVFKRDCVDCPDSPKCPSCKDGEVCTYTTQSCSECAKGICVPDPEASSSSSSSSSSDKDSDSSGGTNAGAIAGGVIGGVVVVALVVGFILWKKYYSKRRPKNDELGPIDADDEKRYTRASFSSVNTSNTRSSNIIPIAYIPGVQNRSDNNNNNNSSNVPPMPDVNATMYGDQFFSADDLMRNSHLSTATGNMRGSFATDYRGSTAVIDDTMMTAVTVKPNLVNVGDKATTATAATARQVPSAYQIGSAKTVSGSRVNAHSIRIGKGAPIGLQNDTITEEHGAVHAAQQSESSGLDLPFVIDESNNNENNDAASVRSKNTNSTLSFQSARSRPAPPSQRQSMRRTQAGLSEYVMEDMPIEAYLYANHDHETTPTTNNENDPDTKITPPTPLKNENERHSTSTAPSRRQSDSGRISPFDDRYTL